MNEMLTLEELDVKGKPYASAAEAVRRRRCYVHACGCVRNSVRACVFVCVCVCVCECKCMYM